MTHAELMRRCRARGWACNNFTFYLIESGKNAGRVAVLMSCNLSVTHYWLRQEELTNAVSVLFLLVRKVKAMYNLDIMDLL